MPRAARVRPRDGDQDSLWLAVGRGAPPGRARCETSYGGAPGQTRRALELSPPASATRRRRRPGRARARRAGTGEPFSRSSGARRGGPRSGALGTCRPPRDSGGRGGAHSRALPSVHRGPISESGRRSVSLSSADATEPRRVPDACPPGASAEPARAWAPRTTEPTGASARGAPYERAPTAQAHALVWASRAPAWSQGPPAERPAGVPEAAGERPDGWGAARAGRGTRSGRRSAERRDGRTDRSPRALHSGRSSRRPRPRQPLFPLRPRSTPGGRG